MKYSTAYVSGGATFGVNFLPEHARSWEGGLKADWLDHRLRTNLAVWSAKYDNMQTEASGLNLIPPLPQLGEVITNTGNARARGFEFEGSVLPLAGLTLSGSVGYTDFKYLTVNPGLGTLATFLPGLRPKWTANLGAQYESEPLFGDSRIKASIEGNYRSQMRITDSPQPPGSDPALTFSPGAWVVNARVALDKIPLPRVTGTVALWVKNLNNDKSIDFADAIGLLESAEWQRSRSFGVDFSIDF